MERMEAAELMHLAINEPRRLAHERSRIEALAGRRWKDRDQAKLIEHGERMARWIRKGQVLVN